MIYCTFRDAGEQARLYRQGRTKDQIKKCRSRLKSLGFDQLSHLLKAAAPIEGSKLTFAGPGESFHQYGLAYDCVPLVNGKPEWRTRGTSLALWQQVGALGESVGLEWAGSWGRFKEFPHFQLIGDKTISSLMAEHYGAGQPAIVTASALAGASESDAFRAALSEPNTQLFVVASIEGSSERELTELYRRAELLRHLNPAVLRVFWLHSPHTLDSELREMMWGAGPATVTTVVYLGSGLLRQTKTFTLADLTSDLKLSAALTGSP
jgi:peptidoglycan L-alanyl-D-glutamate endopeptidase CwlK